MDDNIRVRVEQVSIPAMSTIGTGRGREVLSSGKLGKEVVFAGDHRPMRDLGEAVAAAKRKRDLPIADVPTWAVL